jgi:2-dehydro-3-deoxyphosphogluconate aldolase/(4S)-4-hydroxy-2-oxoglutarate aldolase
VSAVERIRQERIVAVLRRLDDVHPVVDALAGAGVGVVEVTLDAASALADIEGLRERGDVTVLAGTVRTPEDVDAAVAAGAEACVSPAFSGAVVARCHHLAVPVIPGAFTATEVEAAWRAGAAIVKLFPARLGGPPYVRDLLAPLADVPLLPTGGVDAANAADYLRAGAAAVGVGSWLTSGDVVARAQELVAAVQSL